MMSTGLGKALILDRSPDYWAECHAADRTREAPPIRDAGGRIAAAISVSSAAQYMDDLRMAHLSEDVRATAAAIGRDLGARDPNIDLQPESGG